MTIYIVLLLLHSKQFCIGTFARYWMGVGYHEIILLMKWGRRGEQTKQL